MVRGLKKLTKSLFRLCGLHVRRIPRFGPYDWLKGRNIHTVFDIGANVGQFASQIHRVLPDAMLYSFEPLEDCYSELVKKMAHLPRFRAFNFALGDTNGQVEIYRNDFTPSSSLLPMEELHKQAFPFTAHVTTQRIEIRRLDDVSQQLDIVDDVLVKIDVQGTEDKVILGGEKLLSRASVLIVETSFQPLYVQQPLFEDIYDLVRQDFRYIGSFGEPRINRLDGTPLFEDSLFVKRSNKS